MKKLFGILGFSVIFFTFTNAQTYDLASKFKMLDRGLNGVAVDIKGEVTNLGTATLTSFDIHYQVDGGAIQTTSISSLNLGTGEKHSFTHPVKFTPGTAGTLHKIMLWADQINGSNADENTENDLDSLYYMSNTGTGVSRTVLLEHVASVKDGNVPDGYAIIDQLMTANPGKLIPLNFQMWGIMVTFEATEIVNKIGAGTSTALIDRIKWPQYTKVNVPRADWNARVTERINTKTPVWIELKKVNYNTNNSMVECEANFHFVDYVAGDIRVTCLVTEDFVHGEGQDYNQSNYYDNVSGHPFYHRGNPIITDMYHHYVVRSYLSADWGDWIDKNMPGYHFITKDTTVSVTFKPRVIPDNWNLNQMHVVVMVAYYTEDVNTLEVLNVAKKKLTTVSIEENSDEKEAIKVYPNPVNDFATVDFSLSSTEKVIVEVYNTLGEQVILMNNGTYAPGDNYIMLNTSELPSGAYLVRLTAGNHILTERFIK